ncbi:thiamine phosphate synthase [Paraglaciecola sp.]|uniref:thiamine phosphate synthase n=1 Tax=Paraglaciecola sp. TaxID=1920173 RepID=UPI0030F3E589
MAAINVPALQKMSEPQPARPIVWSIAASDSGGGAGLQADNLTIHDLGAHPCNIVTAITAQNSLEVQDIAATPTDMLTKQLNCLLSDMPPQAIKIGVLANATQMRCLSHWLSDIFAVYQQQHGITVPIIWDPVMFATTGQALSEPTDKPQIKDYLQLAKHVSLLTPNAKEFMLLLHTTTNPENPEQWLLWLEILAHSLQSNVLLTGGDQQQANATDWLMVQKVAHTSVQHQQQIVGFSSATINTPHNHGTGCTFSSAIATTMAFGYPLLDAICIAKAYVNQGLSAAYGLGHGAGVLARQGWPETLHYFPNILLPKYPNVPSSKVLQFTPVSTPLQVYPVTQSLQVLQQVLEAGARTVQLRIKHHANPEQLAQQIQQAVALGKQYQAQVFINDHWQLAIEHGAFGVHLGQEDMLEADLAQIAKHGLALGLSSHGYFELLIAQQLSPSYLAIGHIFPTPTKNMPSQAQGLLKLKRYCNLLKDKMPLVAIGGISATNLKQVHACGVDTVAIVRAVEQTPEPALSWQQLQQQWEALG